MGTFCRLGVALISEGDISQAVADAAGRGAALEILGGGSKRALGKPPSGEALDVSGHAGIVDYDPCELVLTARAGTRVAEIEDVLAANRQMLAFEPPDWRALLGTSGEATLGGLVACNLSGPRRVRAGACRDHFLGFSAVDGTGQAWRAGGRVVKNVTGYDLCKLQAGAFGTLSVLTEISVRVLPAPEHAGTLLVPAANAATAFGLLSAALNTPFEVSGAAWLPDAPARRAGLPPGGHAALRVEGPRDSVAYRLDALAARIGRGEVLDAARTVTLWQAVRDVAGLLPDGPRCVWRICTTPSEAAGAWEAIGSTEGFFDWGGGALWVSLEAAGDEVRAAIAGRGGHARLIAAPAHVRAHIPVFHPQAAPVAALQARLKRQFDPLGILNPGRMG